jgi:predicted oxidoreductase
MAVVGFCWGTSPSCTVVSSHAGAFVAPTQQVLIDEAALDLLMRTGNGHTTADDRVVDVLVVGVGAAGAAAALEAMAAGASVAILDQLPEFGGTAATSGGGLCIAGSSSQRERGIVDSPQDGLADLIAWSGGGEDETWARRYFESAERDVHDWLVGLGVEFVDVRPQEGDRVPRWHRPRGAGRAIMEALRGALDRTGLPDDERRWRMGTTVRALLWEDGRAIGVDAEAPDGRTESWHGGTVILATGGFAGDLPMIRRHIPWLGGVEKVLVGGGAGALGSGHRLLEAADARFANLDAAWVYAHATPDPRDPTGRRGLVIRGFDDAIWVDRRGRRFHDESRPGPGTGTPAVLALDPPVCWAILDSAGLERIRVADDAFRDDGGTPREQIEALVATSPRIFTADTPERLAAEASIDAAGLVATLREWDGLLVSGRQMDPVTGRDLSGVRALAKPPFVAITFMPLVRKNLGGVQTDADCRVLRSDGTSIQGLYAAGELAGLAGGHLAGRRAQEGIMLGASLFSGRVAGRAAAAAALAVRATPTMRP